MSYKKNFVKKTTLVESLVNLSKENEFKYFDLTTLINLNYDGNIGELFFECDHHYNEKENKIISKIIHDNLINQDKLN